MKHYKVTMYFCSVFYVEAEDEFGAECEADKKHKNRGNVLPIPDDYEIECLDEEEDEN